MKNALLCSLFLIPTVANCADIAKMITAEARRQGLEPAIAVAIATVESGLNPHAVGSRGEIGLFQLRPEYFNYSKQQLANPKINAKLGIQHLIYMRKNCPSQLDLTWVACYNSGINRHPKYPHLLPYYKKFRREYVRL